MPHFKAIAAMADNTVIGHQGQIPWHLPEDFRWFKKTTMGQHLLMGRKTYDSIGRPLPGRSTYVLSRQEQTIPGVTVINDLTPLRQLPDSAIVWLAGGAELYSRYLKLCSELYLTRIPIKPAGDTFFPEFESDFELQETVLKTEHMTIEKWSNLRQGDADNRSE